MKFLSYYCSELEATLCVPLNHVQLLKGTTLPLWIGGVDGFPPPFVGAIAVPETVPLKSGDSVAAYVDENWILAEVKVQNFQGHEFIYHMI